MPEIDDELLILTKIIANGATAMPEHAAYAKDLIARLGREGIVLVFRSRLVELEEIEEAYSHE